MQEIWKDVKGYEGLYKVSNLGRLKSLKRYKKNHSKVQLIEEKILKIQKSTDGYSCITISKNGKLKTYKTHKFVAEAFLENPNNYTEVNHINGIKTNNRANNLEYCSRSENLKHAHRLGLRKAKIGFGSENPNAKRVIQYTKDMEFIKKWDCITEASIEFNTNRSSITSCCKGRLKTAGGYIWRYDDGLI